MNTTDASRQDIQYAKECGSVKEFAHQLFRNQPGLKKTNVMDVFSVENENDPIAFLFETLLAIYLEGLYFLNKNDIDVAKMMKASPTTFDNFLNKPKEWMQSIGYNLLIQHDDYDQFYLDSYCIVRIAKDSYQLVANKNYKVTNELNKIKCVYFIPGFQYKIVSIRFAPI